jgi:integrase
MEIVEPIRDKNLIYNIYDYLENKKCIGVANNRDYLLVYVGFNTGLRISDLLSLRKFQFLNKEHLILRESKTKKLRKMIIKPRMRKIVNDYIEFNNIQDFLFTARYKDTSMSRKTAYYIMKDIEKRFKLRNIGTHTLKKTFGYHFFKDTNKFTILQRLFNHASAEETLKYIGINQDELDEVLIDFEI